MKAKIVVSIFFLSFFISDQIIAESDTLMNSRFYVDLFGHYAFLAAPRTVIFTEENSETEKNIYGSFGEGISYGINAGYFLNGHVSLELGFAILSGKEFKATNTSTVQTSFSETTFKSSMSQLNAAVKFSSGKKYKPFAKFGIVYGFSGELVYDLTLNGSGIVSNKIELEGGGCMGIKGTFGIDLMASKNFSIIFEAAMINLAWAPTDAITTHTHVDANGNIIVTSDHIDLVDEVEHGLINKELKEYYSFGSFGISFGLKYMIGK